MRVKILCFSTAIALLMVACSGITYMKIGSFYKNGNIHFESNDSIDMTIPDQSLSVREILENFTSGKIELPQIEVGDDEDIDALDSFDDMIEAQDTLNSFAESVTARRNLEKDSGENIKSGESKNATPEDAKQMTEEH